PAPCAFLRLGNQPFVPAEERGGVCARPVADAGSQPDPLSHVLPTLVECLDRSLAGRQLLGKPAGDGTVLGGTIATPARAGPRQLPCECLLGRRPGSSLQVVTDK